MNVTEKLDLDGMLEDWPAPGPQEEAAWEAQADRILKAAQSQPAEDTTALVALLAPPALAPEPGEEQAETISREITAAGGAAAGSGASLSSGKASRPPDKKRTSLKEIAERASQSSRASASGAAGSGRSTPPTPLPSGRTSALSTPLPSGRTSALSTPLPSGRASALSTPLPSGHGSIPPGGRVSSTSLRASDADNDDSGIIHLDRLNAAATAEGGATAESAQPTSGAALQDAARSGAAAASISAARSSRAAPAGAVTKRGSGGFAAGAAIAALGLAAGVAMMIQSRSGTTPTPTVTVAVPAAPTVAAPVVQPEQAPQKPAPVIAAPAEPQAAPAGPERPAADESKVAATRRPAPAPGGEAPSAPAAPTAPMAPAAPPEAEKVAQGQVAAAEPSKPEDLSSAMQAAVGAEGGKSLVTEAPEPASGALRNQNMPEQPSQGSVQAAIGSVMGAARACVVGADDISRAQITFSSSGAVSKVNVTGWAAESGQASCVQSALKAANVGPFSKPSFSVSVTIRAQ